MTSSFDVESRHVIEFPAVDNPHLLDLLKKCLLRDPRERPSIQELKKHPYFQADPPPPPGNLNITMITMSG